MKDFLVFLVEDNEDDEQLTLRAIKGSTVSCDVQVARDGVDAIEQLKKFEERFPDMILLDLKLPKMSGLEVLAKARKLENFANVPIVCLTSSDELGDIENSYEFGANSFVRKPIDFTEYIDSVGQVVYYWLILNRFSPRLVV
jgi:two-component system, response regulator